MSIVNYSESNNDKDTGVLQDIDEENIPYLRDVFKKDWPKYAQTYYFLNTMNEWRKTGTKLPARILCPNGKWQSGTLVAIVNEWNFKVYFFTIQETGYDLMKILYTTNKINWNGGIFLYDCHENFIESMMNILIPNLNLPVEYFMCGGCWHLAKEKALQFHTSCPVDVYISKLSPQMSHIINANWPQVHKFEGSQKYIETIITNNKGMGLFSKNDNELRAWVNINEFGGIATVQTVDKYKRKGYSTLLIKELCKKGALKDMDSIACILIENKVSISMFEKIGFVFSHHLRCAKLKTVDNNYIL